MAQDLLAVDDTDHELASGAFKRITTKSALALETMVDRLAIKGIDTNTPVPDVLNIANFMARVSSAPEQSKRDLPNHDGGSAGPRITLVIGAGSEKVIEGAGGVIVESRVEDSDEMPERARREDAAEEEAVLDGEWGLA